MTLTCDWNPYISPRAGQSWPYIVDHLTLAGEEKESTLIALILQNSDIQEKTARNYLTDLNRHGFLRQPERGTYGLRHQPHRKDTPMINPNDSAHVRSLNPTDTALSPSDVRPVSPAQGVPDAPGASLGSSGYRSDPPALNGPQRGAERVSDAEAAEWARLAGEATEGPWTVDPDGDIGAPLAGGLECGMDGHPVLDCPECGVMVARIQGFDGGLDAAFIAAARTAVPRLLADRERLTAENARMRQVAELRVGTWRDTAARLEGERDRARGTAATLEAENARLREGIESMMRDVGKAQPAHVTPGIVAVRLKALLADTDSAKDEGGEG